MSGALDGQIALITGGASGLGAAIVDRFVEEGAGVVVLDRSPDGIRTMESRHGDRVLGVVGDVRDHADNERAVRACLEYFGSLDVAVGNAGIWDYNTALVDLPADRLNQVFDELFQVNVLGYLQLARAALAPLAKNKGSILYTVSNAGYMPGGGGPLYTATKHAVVGLIRQLAWELAPRVRVNGIAPGAIATALKGPESLGMAERRFPGERLAEHAGDFVPLGRMPTAAEYAGAYVFFASRRDNVPATGAILNHDGGFSIRGIDAKPRGGDDLLARLGLD